MPVATLAVALLRPLCLQHRAAVLPLTAYALGLSPWHCNLTLHPAGSTKPSQYLWRTIDLRLQYYLQHQLCQQW